MDSKDDSQKSKPIEQCLNCSFAPLDIDANFCPACGQDCRNKRITVWHLIEEAFANFFNLDHKFWQTLFNIFLPGKLTNEFLKGRRQQYISPLRIFLITSIIFFGAVQVNSNDSTSNFFNSTTDGFKKDSYYSHFLEKLSLESDTLSQSFSDTPQAPLILDSLQSRMSRFHDDSTTIGAINLFSKKDSLSSLVVANKDLVELSQDSLVNLYKNGHFLDDLLLKQNIKLAVKGENFFSYLLEQLVWMMLLMMPFLAMFLKLIYIRSDFFYVDHLIFLFHTHTFVFVISSLLILLNSYFPNATFLSSINTVGIISMPIYLFLAMLKVYQQSKTKTFIKLLMINFCYTFLFILSIALTSVIAALNF